MPASADLASRHDWRDIFALLDTALELEQAQHDAWLEALPAESARLSPLLKDLLRAHAGIGTGDFMRAPANFVLPAGPSPPEPAAHSLVGPYRLLREIGTGGMASVWLAERADGLLDRQVALKLPHAGRGMASLAERMARERNILASLTHPNIARLYDAGITADGRPFLALEYVDGRPIDEYAAAADLEMGARVELILQVARAVAYAHSGLVVHRDLKPSNILVDAQGAVHLLDFGIARLVDPQVEDGAAGVRPVLAVEAQGRVLTPDYASPEQIRGEPIGTASDVYSLGIVAYELWAEVKPYKLKAEGGDALSAAIAAVELRRASTAAANPGARDALKGDLDAILDRALKHDVAARYPTAEALAQDLERHLAHRPVRARPDAPGYRLARFLRRNWLAVAAAAAVSVSLIAGISIATWQAREALAQANRAQRVKDFIGTLFATADPYVVGKPGGTVRDLLDAASARIERELQREPAMAAELLGLLANSYRKLGEVDHALGAAQRADALAAQAYPESHAMRVRAMRVLAQALNDKGNDEEARHLLRAALAMQLRQGSDPAELAQTMMALASAVLDQGHEAEAVVLLRDAVQRLERAYGSDSPLTIQARGELSNKLLTANLRQEALQVAEQSVQAARALYQTPDHPAVVEQLSHYAYALSVNGRAREAREQWQAIVAADRKTFNPRGPQVSLALEALGRSQQSLGELNDALASFEEALAIMQGFGAQGGGELAIRHFSIGRVALQARQGQRALDRLDQAIAIGAKAYGADSARVRDAGNFRAEALVRVGRLADARAVLDQRTAEDRARDAPDLWRELRILALLDLARSDFAAAFAHLTEADVLARQKGDGSPKALAQLRAELGRAALEVGRIDEAVALLEEASAALGKMEPTATPQQAEVWLALGRARLRQGRVAEGLAQIEAADAFWRAFEPEHAQAGETAYWLGHAQAQAGNKRAAQLQLARATPLLAASTWPMLQQLMTVVRN